MPARAIVFGVVAVVTVSAIVYDQRENIVVLADRSRQKLAQFLRQIADQLSFDERRRTEEVPMAGRPFSFQSTSGAHDEMSHRRNPFEDPREPEQTTATTGRDVSRLGHLRHRGAEPQEKSSVLSDAAHDSPEPAFNEKATHVAPAIVISAIPSKRSSAAPENPLPIVAADGLPSESGYETAAQPQVQVPGTSGDIASQSSRTVPDSASNENSFVYPEPFWSIHEWQENTTQDAPVDRSTSPSLAGSAIEDLDAISDIASDFGSDRGSEPGSVGSWTEVASEFSDDHLA